MTTRLALAITPLLFLLGFLFVQSAQPGLAQSAGHLASGGSLAGRALDSQGRPVAQIRVQLYRWADNTGEWSLFAYIATTGDGAYVFRALPVGTYRLGSVDLRWPEQYGPTFYQRASTLAKATNIRLGEDEELSAIDMQLSMYSQMTGVVTDQQGQPIANIMIGLYSDPDYDGEWMPIAKSSPTDHTGAYTMSQLLPGPYRVEFTDRLFLHSRYQPEFYHDALTLRAATTLTLSEGITLTGINAQLGPSARILGQVTNDDGQPVSNGYISLHAVDCTECIKALRTITPDAAGFYTFTGVIAGSYHLGFSLWGDNGNTYYYQNATQKADATTIIVTAGATITGIHAQIPTRGVLTGSVTGPAGQPAPQIRVTALREITNTYGAETWQVVAYTATSADGRYAIHNLLSGRYRLRFTDQRPEPRLYSSQYYTNALYIADAASITLTSKITISDLDVQLAGVGQISRQVQDSAGTPLSNIKVSAWPQPSAFDRHVFDTTTGADGSYALVGVDIGTYIIRFADPTSPSQYVAEYYDDALDADQAVPVVVAADTQVTAINAQLMPDRSSATSIQLWLPLIYK
jgi:5-hydroxyisourate hydrolase-like protein (transthyretin family)